MPITTAVQKQDWDELASRSAVGNMCQCLWWAQPLAQFGVTTHILGCWKGRMLVGGGLIRSMQLPFLGMHITECLYGPIFVEWSSEWADLFVRRLQELAGEMNSLTVSIRYCPNKEVHRDLVQAFARAQLKVKLIPGVEEGVLLLKGRTMDDFWKNFRTGTKRNVKKGLTGQIRVERITSSSHLLSAYESWMSTARRKGFPDVRPWPALEPVLRHSVESGMGQVLATFLDDRLLASVFVTYIGERGSYVYGGYMDGAECYHPTHVLQYIAIQESLERGMTAYTFGDLHEKSSRNGVDQFKLGFGAIPQRNLDTIIWERRPLYHRLIRWLRHQSLGKSLETFLMRRRGA
jgi:lipid II:glycine glycyltransferase (peptidoglycan interpeptide bridge formation enzyme)